MASSMSLRELRHEHELAWNVGSNYSDSRPAEFEVALRAYNNILTSICTGASKSGTQMHQLDEADDEFTIDWESEISEVLYDFSHFILLNPSIFLSHSDLKWPSFLLSTYPSVNDVISREVELREEEQFMVLSTVVESGSDDVDENPSSHLVPIISWNTLGFAAEMGNPNAQHVLATAYSTGVFAGYLVPMDATRALILEHMSALSGHIGAHMGMGFRYMNGIVVDESCERALPHYEFAANHANQQLMARRYSVYIEKMKLAEVDNGQGKIGEVTPEVLDYYIHLANEGDVSSALSLSNIYRRGSRSIDADHDLAMVRKLIWLAKSPGDVYVAALLEVGR
jgi:hypothetical protein